MTSAKPPPKPKETATKSMKRKRAPQDDRPRTKSVPKALQGDQLTIDDIRAYIDSRPMGNAFKIEILPLPKKQPKPEDTLLLDVLSEPRLTTHCNVRPRNAWETMTKFKRFTVGDDDLGTDEKLVEGDCILVNHDDTAASSAVDTLLQWKAVVLEIRAIDPEHVYLLVAWLNRPEDLAEGRKDHHGKLELIPTNQLEIIDAMCVNGGVELVHWDDDDDDSDSVPMPGQYFWRQTYDAAYTGTFSEFRTICKDEKPHNPDEMIVQCEAKDCQRWMHVRCIAEDAIEQYAALHPERTGKSKSSRKSQSTQHDPPAGSSVVYKLVTPHVSAHVYIKGAPDPKSRATMLKDDPGSEEKPAIASDKSFVRLFTENYGAYEQPVCCLLCDTVIP